jgi:Flp pilus assembly protein TadG
MPSPEIAFTQMTNGFPGRPGKAKFMRQFKRLHDEAGQVIAFSLVCMVVLLAMVGFAVDAGHAYLVQRQLQSGVDAAALAGAQELPDATLATSVARQYGPNAKNPATAVDNATTTVAMKCVKSAPGCSSQFSTYNAVQVTASSSVSTFFARVLGIDSLDVKATATACSPCSAKPLDIMIVLDRTGSMCDVSSNGKCRDMDNAVSGVKTFLGFMDPTLDEVGLSVFPPALNKSSLCTQPTSGAKRYGYGAWWREDNSPGPNGEDSAVYALASPDFNYANLISKLDNCLKPNGTTSYTNALAEAQYQLERQGRGNVQDVIIFVSDGAANTAPLEAPAIVNNPTDRARPCGAGVKVANQIKGRGTIVYTIGYDVDADSNGGQCGLEGITASWALQQMASEPDNYYVQPDPGRLNTIFTRIAADISRPASRLIDNTLS